ncbi:MAG TPA: cytochrome c biogenesis CcdA family protein [Herpetosiphonaceae bacterium]|nr:cytochrome c biogenesis CcdA family protein [Herpetosiphonaceae bacterium]
MQSAPQTQRQTSRFGLVAGLLIGGVLIGGLMILGLARGGQNVATLMIPAFIAGILSFLSPCTLPVLPAYFAWTFGINSGSTDDASTKRRRVLLSSLAFFAGLATTMVTLGVIVTTTLGPLVAKNLNWVTKIGGAIIIVMGILSVFGLGFAGPSIKRSRSATLGSAYMYGLTFALGWTACIGPILGAVLTLLVSTGTSVVAGATLTFVYVLGLGLPLMIVATFFNRFGQGSKGWRWLRGRGWEIKLGSRTILLHSTNVLSGLLLIVVGVLLFSGKLSAFNNEYSFLGGINEWANNIQYDIQRFFTGQ